MRNRITPNTDTFHGVYGLLLILLEQQDFKVIHWDVGFDNINKWVAEDFYLDQKK